MEPPSPPPRILTVDLRASSVLQYGQFLGACVRRRESAGFAFVQLIPAVASAEVAKHTHPDAHFVLLVDGIYISAAAAPPLSRPPLLIYNPPGTTHRDRFHTLAGRFFTISVSAESLARIAEFIDPVERPTALVEGHAVALAQRLSCECRRWDAASPLIAEGICLELMAEMTRAVDRKHRQPPSWLRDAREFLNDRCSEDVRISEIARTVGVHPVHLARTFREFFGCTPGDYLRRCRLDRAAVLLARNKLPIARIASQGGFADQSHFSKLFRKAFLMSPSEYRRAHVS